jgi:hypothetical protein
MAKKKTKKTAARAVKPVVPCGPESRPARRFLVLLEVTVQPDDDDPGLWDWETLLDQDGVVVTATYPLNLKSGG